MILGRIKLNKFLVFYLGFNIVIDMYVLIY